MSLRRVFLEHNRKKWINVFNLRPCHQLHAVVENEPKYPPIIDMSALGQQRYKRQLFYDHVQALPTVEQKLFSMIENMKTFYLRTYQMSSCPPSYLGVPFYHYVTRTHIIQDLPEKLQAIDVDQDYEYLKEQMCSSVVKHVTNTWRENKLCDVKDIFSEKECGAKLLNELLIHICRAVALKNPHLISAAFDPRPRIDSYWWHGGFECRKQSTVEKSNICFQFCDYPYFTVRLERPLVPVVPIDDPLCSTAEVVDYNYHPRQFGNPFARRFLTCIAGTWPGDICGFPLLQCHTYDRINNLTNKLDHYDYRKVEEAYAVMTSFGWLNSLAVYQGFSPFHDVTYPFVGQTILTNGQDWTFFLYQLNTIALHSDVDQKDRRNLCWCSKRMRLFESLEDGQLKGLNEEVFKTLLKMTLNTPSVVSDRATLSPYLSEDTRSQEEIVATRKQMRRFYRNVRHSIEDLNEIPFWHHVYVRNPDAPPCPSILLR